ncbi:MAG: hypothetical protein LJE89_00070 [Deltaproteobacteria bacterium]|nr:hypothetical protein [Deltaproteobacteria bacterium]
MIFTLAVAMIMGFALPAMADCTNATDVVTLGAGSVGVNLQYGVSQNVYVTFDSDNNYQDYGLATTHKAGNRFYGTTNNTTLIYYGTKSTGSTSVTAPTAGSSDLTSYGTAL